MAPAELGISVRRLRWGRACIMRMCFPPEYSSTPPAANRARLLSFLNVIIAHTPDVGSGLAGAGIADKSDPLVARPALPG